MIVATAGHIDHGKTTLVRALTGVDTDRLPEEKARGISIDLGFAYRATADGGVIGFVDVPGHERFVRNMLAGVCGIDFVMLIVAADDGVMPQTIEHLHIVSLLDVRRGVAVITKTDRVSPERVAEVTAQVRELLAPTQLSGAEVIPVSAVNGASDAGLAKLRVLLEWEAKEKGAREQAGRHFRYAIDRVFAVAGSGTVVTGTVMTGAVAGGDRMSLTPGGIEVRIRGIQKDGKSALRAVAGERCALNLAGVEVGQIQRGDWVVAPVLHAPTQRLDVRLQLLDIEDRPLRHWTPVYLHVGTAAVTARLSMRRGEAITPGRSALAQLVLDAPIAALAGDRFIVRDVSATRTLGGGVVINPFAEVPSRRGIRLRAVQLEAYAEPDPSAVLSGLLEASPSGVNVPRFGLAFNLMPERISTLLHDNRAVIVDREAQLAVLKATVVDVGAKAVEAVKRFHDESPQATGMEMADLRKQIAPAMAANVFVAVLRESDAGKKLEITGSTLRLPRHNATDNPADEKTWKALQPVFDAAGFNVPGVRALAAAAKLSEATTRDFLHRKAKAGTEAGLPTAQLVRVNPERFFPRATLAKLAADAQTVAQAAPGGQFTAAQFRDRVGVGRDLCIEVLECFDRLGITLRLGNARKMRKDYVTILGSAD